MEEDLEATIHQTLHEEQLGGEPSMAGSNDEGARVLLAAGSDGTSGTAQSGTIVSRMSFAPPKNAAETEARLVRDQARWTDMVAEERKTNGKESGNEEAQATSAIGSFENTGEPGSQQSQTEFGSSEAQHDGILQPTEDGRGTPSMALGGGGAMERDSGAGQRRLHQFHRPRRI